MPPTYLQHSHCHGLGQQQHVNIYRRHNLTHALIAGLPAKSISAQLRRQAGDQCLTDCVGDKSSHCPRPWQRLCPRYRIYSCISRPFTTKKSAQKIALDLYTSRTHRPDKAIQEINITIVWSAFTKPVLIVVEFLSFWYILRQQKSVK